MYQATWAVFVNEPHNMEDTLKAVQELGMPGIRTGSPTANYDLIDGMTSEMYYSIDGRCYEEV